VISCATSKPSNQRCQSRPGPAMAIIIHCEQSRAERANGKLMEAARSIMHSGVQRYLGDEAIMMAALLLDGRISSVDDAKTPFELCKKKKPRLSKMHVFGCDVYCYKADRENAKLDEREG
jgi:hypothetical protein